MKEGQAAYYSRRVEETKEKRRSNGPRGKLRTADSEDRADSDKDQVYPDMAFGSAAG